MTKNERKSSFIFIMKNYSKIKEHEKQLNVGKV